MRHCALEVGRRDGVLGTVGRAELGKAAGRGEVRPGHVIERAAAALRQAAITGILELLDAQRQRDVGCAGRYGVDRAAECLGTAGAEVFDPGHRDVGQAQRHRQRHGGLADMLLLDRGGEPGGIDLLGVDAGVGHCLPIGLDHQVAGVHIPAFAELRAPHTEDGDLVANTLRHLTRSRSWIGWARPSRSSAGSRVVDRCP